MMLRLVAGFLMMAAVARAQEKPIGTVGIQDATVAGALVVSNGRAILVGSAAVTAKDRTAELTLHRGGEVRVCSTSGLHVAEGKSVGDGPAPLMLALDRGAIEVEMAATSSDVVMTPDLRLTMGGGGALDLRLRVATNGDTCVENRGAGAPVLKVAGQFGGSSYELHAGQHVMFEHGDLKEVVDNESTPCGCPPAPVVSVADAGVSANSPATAAAAGSVVAEQHPFPAAVSEGLAPPPAVPQAAPGVVHTQVATSLSYDANAPQGAAAGAGAAEASGAGAGAAAVKHADDSAAAAPVAATVPAAASTVVAEAPPAPAAPPAKGVFRSIGHFFKRLFGGK
jgi:hypothetical protein